MGIEGQAARLKKCAGPKRKVDTITSTSGRKTFVVGVDMSCIMMTGVKQKPGAEEYHADPPLPQHHTAKFTFDKVRKYKNANVEVIGVFDGISRTPLKQENAGGSRDDSRDKALQRLQQLLQKPWPATEEEQQKILSLIDKYIHKIFGKRNGVRRRALNRLRNGHFYIDTLKSAKVKSKAKYGNRRKDLYIIQCQCLASMRSNVYTVNLVINKNGDFIKSPYSRCSCAAGNMFCAHMLGLNLLCQVAKKHQNWDRNILQENLPSHVEQVQRLCIPVSGMWNKKMNTR